MPSERQGWSDPPFTPGIVPVPSAWRPSGALGPQFFCGRLLRRPSCTRAKDRRSLSNSNGFSRTLLLRESRNSRIRVSCPPPLAKMTRYSRRLGRKEGHEDAGPHLGSDSLPRIGNGNDDVPFFVDCGRRLYLVLARTPFRNRLSSVDDQIENHLTQAGFVAIDQRNISKVSDKSGVRTHLDVCHSNG